MILRNVNSDIVYPKIVRQVSYIQLYKIIKFNTKKIEVNGYIEDKLISRDWEFVIIDRTSDTEIKDGIDPIEENFDNLFLEAEKLEFNKIKFEKILNTRKKRWAFVENKIFKNELFSNLSAERNTSLLFQALHNYEQGTLNIRWSNLDGSYIEITENNIEKLKSLYNEICLFHQLSFDAVNFVIEKIQKMTQYEDLYCLDIDSIWEDALANFNLKGYEIYEQ